MKILFAGKFDPQYNRTKIIIDGLKSLPEVELDFYNYNEYGSTNFLKFRKACKYADVIFLPSFTHKNVPLIKWLTLKPIIFDPLISRYLTKVFDHKKVAENSAAAYKYLLKDRRCMRMADIVLCDTQSHRQYYQEVIGVPENKLRVLPVGVNIEEFKPITASVSNDQKFIVGFYGSFVPLQGAARIMEAAKLLQNDDTIHFRIIGSGHEFENVKNFALEELKLSNIEFCGWVDYDELPAALSSFDVCLGIFGESIKADLVIPNKIYHYAAMQKAIITRETQGIKEIFQHDVDIMLCNNTPEEIVRSILELKNNPELRKKLALNAFEKITKGFNQMEIGKKFITIAGELV